MEVVSASPTACCRLLPATHLNHHSSLQHLVAPPRLWRKWHFGMMACSSPLLLLLVVLTLFTGCSNVHGIRETYFIAADLGTDAMKAVAFRRETTVDGAATSTGGGVAVSLDLVLNDQANRRSPPCVALRYFPHYNSTTGETQLVQERALAEQAHALSIRFPTQVVCAPTTLLGRESDAPDVAPRRAGNRVVAASPQRKTAAVFVPTKASGGEDASGSIFTAEELTGMLLGYLKRMAEKADRDYNDLSAAEIEQLVGTTPHAAAIDEPWTADFGLKGGIARYATIVMPAHSSVAARQAMVDAGAAAGLRVVHVCHPTTAAAVQLAHMKAQQLFASTDKPVTLMIFDMGRHKTEAAVFQLAPINAAAIAAQTKTKHLAGLEGSIVLKGLATNPHLGGEDFDRCIAEVWDRESLGSRFFGTTTDSQETLEHVKQRQSLLRAANRAREMLSANREIPVTVEGVSVEGTSGPFTTHLTREQLVTACAPLFDAAVAVRDAAIESTSGLIEAASQLDRLEVIGGATRMPELQRRLARGYNPRGAVDRTLNGDEAAVMGAAFLGAVALKQSRRQFTVLEWLTNSISFAVSPPLQASDAAVPAYELHDLFHARKSLLPDVQSVVLHDRHDNFVFSFFSLPASATAQDGCFAQHSSIEGVVAAREKAKSVEGDEKVSSLITQRLDLVDTEVVVEAIASDSGIPYINKVYLRATYNKTTTTFTRQVSSLEKQKTVETEEAASSSSTTDGIKEGDIEASGDDSAANTAEEAAQAPLEETLVMSTMESTTVIRAFALTARLTHDTTIPGPCSSTAATREELTLYKSQLLAMQRSDDMRTYKGALRNDIESMLMHLKATHAWEDDTTPEGLPPSWKEEVRQISDWLDDEAEVADHNQLMAQKKELLRLGKEIEQLAGQ